MKLVKTLFSALDVASTDSAAKLLVPLFGSRDRVLELIQGIVWAIVEE